MLTTLVPGTGLLTTRMRRLGWVLLALLVLAVIVLTAVLVFGDPLRTGMMIVTNRALLIGILVAAGVAGLVWAAQIVLANLAHTTRQRLHGAKKYLALALAALMVVAIAVPFGRGVQSVWAVQALLGSKSVFGGQEGGESPIVKGKDPWAGTDRVNIMLLGQDSGEDRTGTRPDTIMMASIDTSTGKTALFSIPRNLEGVRFPEGTAAAEEFPDGFDYFGKNQDLINAVWTWADDRPDLFPDDPEPGLTATTWAVEETLGLETDYYAMVNLQGFEDLVNAIGGVDLVVERRIPIGGGTNQATGGSTPSTGTSSPATRSSTGSTRSGTPAPERAPTTSTACAVSSAWCAPSPRRRSPPRSPSRSRVWSPPPRRTSRRTSRRPTSMPSWTSPCVSRRVGSPPTRSRRT